jgi:hypothetical protein
MPKVRPVDQHQIDMADDRMEVEYHLTPAGWVTGTITDFGHVENITEAPPDRVETWLYEMEQSSGWSGESRSWRTIWIHATMAAPQRKALRESFPTPRTGLPTS